MSKKLLTEQHVTVMIIEYAAQRGLRAIRPPYLASKVYRRCHKCTQLQYKVAEGDVIKVEKLGVEAGETVTFDNVIAVSNDGLKVGEDVKDASVTASVVENGKNRKVIVYKYKRKTGYHKKNGHRQQYTKVKIEKING